MLLSQVSLGKSLGRTDQAVAGREKTGKIPKYADIMLRMFKPSMSTGGASANKASGCKYPGAGFCDEAFDKLPARRACMRKGT